MCNPNNPYRAQEMLKALFERNKGALTVLAKQDQVDLDHFVQKVFALGTSDGAQIRQHLVVLGNNRGNRGSRHVLVSG